MKKHLMAVILAQLTVLLISSFSFAIDEIAPLGWIRTHAITNTDHGWGGATDEYGNMYAVGSSGDLWSANCVIVKYDTAGNMVWHRSYNAGQNEFCYGAIAKNNNLYVTGRTMVTDNQINDFVTLKYDLDGNLIWNVTTDTGNPDDVGRNVDVDASGNVYVAGQSATMKYDSSGALVWTVPDFAYGITVDAAGNAYVAGYSIRKYDGDGNLLWENGHNYTWPRDIALDADGSSYAVGYSDGASSYDCFIQKYDSLGNLVWDNMYDNGTDEFCNAIEAYGDTLLTSGSRENATLPRTAYLMQIEKSGGWLATQTHDATSQNFGTGLATDSTGSIFVPGFVHTPGNGGREVQTIKYLSANFVDADGDGYGIDADCDDNDPAINPWSAEIPYNGIDENCNGMADDDDLDGDTYPIATDCDDSDPTVYPGAPEIKHDGVDQDCNGYDLTIDVFTAVYDVKKERLVVEATSSWGVSAALELDFYGPMSWKKNLSAWVYNEKGTGDNPGTVTVCGFEGCTSALTSAP